MFNGFRDSEGNFVTFDGKTWKGLKNDDRVGLVDLGASGLNINFATSTDPDAIRKGAIALRDVLKLQNHQYGQRCHGTL